MYEISKRAIGLAYVYEAELGPIGRVVAVTAIEGRWFAQLGTVTGRGRQSQFTALGDAYDASGMVNQPDAARRIASLCGL